MKINRPKHLILEAVGRFQYLSNEQLRRFIYGSSVLKYVQEATSQLVKEGGLQPLYLPTLSPHGRPRTFYSLTDESYRYLGDRSLPPVPKFKNPQEAFRHGLFLLHFETSNDLLILACDLPRRDSRFRVSRFLSEAQIKQRRPIVRPDSWVEFQVLKPATVVFELDRATEARVDWERKLKAYAHYIDGPYQHDYQVEHFPTIAVVTPDHRRLRELKAWSQDALQRLSNPHLANCLYFAAFTPVEITPLQVFASPIWETIHDVYHQQLLPEDIFGQVPSSP
jgi:hypothetical protein